MERELITFDELLKLAQKENIHPDKVSVGIWAKQKGYIKTRKQKDKKVTIYYYLNI